MAGPHPFTFFHKGIKLDNNWTFGPPDLGLEIHSAPH